MQVITSEFASVSVGVDRSGNDPRLLIIDNHTGRRSYYDALLLEALAWLPDTVRDGLLDPSLHRWSAEQRVPGGRAPAARRGPSNSSPPDTWS
jgi:hypothetical protein